MTDKLVCMSTLGLTVHWQQQWMAKKCTAVPLTIIMKVRCYFWDCTAWKDSHKLHIFR